MTQWIRCSYQLPAFGEVVETKIDDAQGCRNVQRLKRLEARPGLWFLVDESMYVYYQPTHWRPFPEKG